MKPKHARRGNPGWRIGGCVLLATAVVVTIGHFNPVARPSPGPVADLRESTLDDTYVLLGRPDLNNGAAATLVAGGDADDLAVTYLKFRVPAFQGGRPPTRATLRLTRSEGVAPSTAELSTASADWSESTLTARTAPPPGERIALARPDPVDPEINFDLTPVVRRPGEHGFALTAPAAEGALAVRSKEDGAGAVLVLEWDRRPDAESADPTTPAVLDPLPAGPPPQADPPATRPTTGPSAQPTVTPSARPRTRGISEKEPCAVGPKLVPTCGVLWGVAPGGHTETPRSVALRRFEAGTGRTQAIYHAYHRGTGQVFPTAAEIALAREPGRQRLLFLNWKPTSSWASIAGGKHRATNKFLDRLAVHIRKKFPEPFFLTIHHEPEDDVRPRPDSGYTARDFSAMFRYVALGLRQRGVSNVVNVVTYMAYPPWNVKPWFRDMYPGDDVVDWVAFDTYAYSDPGYGHGDFAEMLNRRLTSAPHWPGFYTWAAKRFPHKPLMVAEWGVWHSDRNPAHKARFYETVGRQIRSFPRVKALVHFDTPSDQRHRDSRVDATGEALRAYTALGSQPVFQVSLTPR